LVRSGEKREVFRQHFIGGVDQRSWSLCSQSQGQMMGAIREIRKSTSIKLVGKDRRHTSLFWPAVSVMVMLARAILGRGCHDLWRDFAHAGKKMSAAVCRGCSKGGSGTGSASF